MRISAIVALASNRVIGNQNALPWRISEDLKRFKFLTLGHPVIMGRKTFESIGRALPGRRNLVISRQSGYVAIGAEVVSSLEEAVQLCQGVSEVFIIGGSEIYKMSLPRVDRFYLTEVHCDFEGDAVFPEIDLACFKEIERIDSSVDGLQFSFVTLDRIKKGPR